ncbi:MAG: flagellar biosynthetic protein FliO [Nitrospirae bacterium]|nr:flagellar biosynthetic protein FliO [Nitrospirota bacterium]
MKTPWEWVAVAVFAVGMIGGEAWAGAGVNHLDGVSVQPAESALGVFLNFRGPVGPSLPEIDYKEDLIQIELPGVIVHPPKRTIDVESPFVRQVFVYQYEDEIARVRLLLTPEGRRLIGRGSVHAKKGRILLDFPYPRAGEEPAASRVADVQPGGPVPAVVLPAVDARALSVPEAPPPASSASEAGDKRGAFGTRPTEDKGTAKSPAAGAGPPDFGRALIKMGSGLALVLGLLAALAYGAKRVFSNGMAARSGPGIRVVARHGLGPKVSVAVVEVGGETLVLGVTPGEVQLLSRVEDGPVPQADVRHDPSPRRETPPQAKSNDLFGKILGRSVRRDGKKHAGASSSSDAALEAALAGIQERVNLVGRGAMGGEGGRR